MNEHLPKWWARICMFLVHNSTGPDLSDPFVSRDQMLCFKAPTCRSQREFDPNLHWAPTPFSGIKVVQAYAIQRNQGWGWGWSMLVAIWEQNSGPECNRHCISGKLKEGHSCPSHCPQTFLLEHRGIRIIKNRSIPFSGSQPTNRNTPLNIHLSCNKRVAMVQIRAILGCPVGGPVNASWGTRKSFLEEVNACAWCGKMSENL